LHHLIRLVGVMSDKVCIIILLGGVEHDIPISSTERKVGAFNLPALPKKALTYDNKIGKSQN